MIPASYSKFVKHFLEKALKNNIPNGPVPLSWLN